MANWIQGHNDVTKFKAIVCHDGIFDTKATWYSTEEIYFPVCRQLVCPSPQLMPKHRNTTWGALHGKSLQSTKSGVHQIT